MSMDIEKIARAAHEINRILAISHDNFAIQTWASAPEDQRQMTREAVVFLMANRSAQPHDLHENWMARAADRGFKLGMVRSATEKTEPLMVAWDALPKWARISNQLLHTVVRAIQ
jgi:hypothetical protein